MLRVRRRLLLVLGLGAAACGNPPFIGASLLSFPPGNAPAGYQSASVTIQDATSGDVITGATVTMNDVALSYNPASQAYEGNVDVAPGALVTLSASVGGSTYRASVNQFSSYPDISQPAPGSSLGAPCATPVSWSSTATAESTSYAFGVLDAQDPNGPEVSQVGLVPLSVTSLTLPANSISPGERLFIVGITGQVGIPKTDPQSSFLIGGFNSVQVTVVNEPVVVSLLVTPSSAALPKQYAYQYEAAEMYCDGSGQDVTATADWTSSNPTVAAVASGSPSAGLVSALDGGTTTIAASFGGFSGSTSLAVNGTLQSLGVFDLRTGTWTGTQYVAVGAGGTIVTSPDGKTWTGQTPVTSEELRGVASSGTQLVAVGTGGVILTSPDGGTWTVQSTDLMSNGTLNAITWSGTEFVAVGGRGNTGKPTVLTSADGVAWAEHTATTTYGTVLNAVVWSGSQFVAVGNQTIFISSDGMAWTEEAPNLVSSLNAVAWDGSQFVAVGDSLVTSPDGVTWTVQMPAGGTVPSLGLVWTGTELVAVGDNGFIATSPDGLVYTPWTSAGSSFNEVLLPFGWKGVFWSGTQFVAVGDAILTSQ